jgi:hypothetical protein
VKSSEPVFGSGLHLGDKSEILGATGQIRCAERFGRMGLKQSIMPSISIRNLVSIDKIH